MTYRERIQNSSKKIVAFDLTVHEHNLFFKREN